MKYAIAAMGILWTVVCAVSCVEDLSQRLPENLTTPEAANIRASSAVVVNTIVWLGGMLGLALMRVVFGGLGRRGDRGGEK